MISGIAIIGNFLQWVMWVTAVNLLLPRRLSAGLTWCLEILGFAAYYGLTLLIRSQPPLTRFLMGSCFVPVFFSLFHRGRWYIRFGVPACLLVTSVEVDILTYYSTLKQPVTQEMMMHYDYSVTVYSFFVLANLLLLSLLVLAGWSLRQNSEQKLSVLQMLLFTLFPLSQLALLSRWFNTFWLGRDEMTVVRAMAIVVLTAAAEAAFFHLIRSTSATAALDAAVRYREEEQRNLDRYAAGLLAERERAAAIQEQIDRMWGEMKQTVSRGETGELTRRAEEIGRVFLAGSVLPECGNRVLSGFLARRREELEDKGIRTEFAVIMPARLGVADPDLIGAFGNLLDNAEEACADTEAPYVRLLADVRRPYLRIRMENSYAEDSEKKTRRIPEMERGLGFTILQRMAEKYDGEFRCQPGENKYSVSLMLKEES